MTNLNLKAFFKVHSDKNVVESIRRILAGGAAQEGMNEEGKTCAQHVELATKVSHETKKIF